MKLTEKLAGLKTHFAGSPTAQAHIDELIALAQDMPENGDEASDPPPPEVPPVIPTGKQ